MKNYVYRLMVIIRRFFLPAFFLLCLASNAQSNLEAVYDQEVISFYGDSRYMRNGEVLKRRDVELLLRNNEASLAEFRAYKKHRRISAALQIGMGVFYVSTIALAATNTGAALGTFGLGFGASVAALPMRLEARKHLQRAIFLYNKQVLVTKLH